MRECLIFQMFQRGHDNKDQRKIIGCDGQITRESSFYKVMGMKNLGYRKLKKISTDSNCRMLFKFSAKN